MMGLVVIGLALVVATVQLFVSRKPRTSRRVLDLYLLYTLVVGVGVGYLFGGLGHLLFADRIAEQLGWATGSGFQTEVGLYDVAFGILGICCIWFRDQWWYATSVGIAIFAVGAAVNHARDIIAEGNASALNSMSVLSDLLVPVLLLAFFVVRWALARRADLSPARNASRT